MSETLVDRLAKAIGGACECRNCGLLTYWDDNTQECCDRPSWIPASDRNQAIAILKSMREPTESQVEAGVDSSRDGARAIGRGKLKAAWQAMIDQAIKEGE